MTGTVTSQLKGVIAVEVSGPGGHEETVASLIDTGFDGFLALPAQQIMGLGLPLDGMELVVLADGTEAVVARCACPTRRGPRNERGVPSPEKD